MALVGIVMGSDSDMPVMAKAADILEELGISYEMTIISAHREPDVFFEYAKTAEEKGFKVIIAGAGMAAHLPGMCAAIFPMPVLLISTFNEDGTVDVMNAAWGTMLERDQVALNLTETHKTVQNIKARKGFVVHIADAKHVVEADYFGIVSGNKEPDKFTKSGMTFTKSDLVDAPIINELPIALECEFIEYQNDATGIGVIGKVLRTSVEENLLKDDKVNIDSLEAIAFDPYTHGYYKVGGRVGEAFKDGLKIK